MIKYIKQFIVDNLLYNIIYYYKNFRYWFKCNTKYFIQRGINGYADNDRWDLHRHISSILYKSLNEQIKYGVGYPSEFKDYKEWETILQDMVNGFKLDAGIYYNTGNYCDISFQKNNKGKYVECIKVYDKKGRHIKYDFESIKVRDEALKLLQKYYFCLWD